MTSPNPQEGGAYTAASWKLGHLWAGVMRQLNETRFVVDEEDYYVAEVRGSTPEIRETRARMIVTAPEGLALAQALISYVEQSDTDDLDFGRGFARSGIIDRARAFVLQATGGENGR